MNEGSFYNEGTRVLMRPGLRRRVRDDFLLFQQVLQNFGASICKGEFGHPDRAFRFCYLETNDCGELIIGDDYLVDSFDEIGEGDLHFLSCFFERPTVVNGVNHNIKIYLQYESDHWNSGSGRLSEKLQGGEWWINCDVRLDRCEVSHP